MLMSQPAHTDDDDLVLGLLYEELDDEARVAAEAKLDDAQRAELEGLRRVRSLARMMDEAEPAPAISAQLLAAAAREKPRVAAAAVTEDVGVWARVKSWFGPIVAHPAMAA